MTRGYAAIGMYNPKDHHNLGCVLRAAHCFGASMVAYTGHRYKYSCLDTTKAWRHIPLLHPDDLRLVIPHGASPVAVEIIDGAIPLPAYQHPERAFYVFGPEDGSIDKRVTEWCRDIVSIPTAYCLNLAATVNVVLYDRMMKQARRNTDAPTT